MLDIRLPEMLLYSRVAGASQVGHSGKVQNETFHWGTEDQHVWSKVNMTWKQLANAIMRCDCPYYPGS